MLQLPVHGQGVYLFKGVGRCSFLLNDSDNITRIYVAFVEGAVTVITDIVLIDYNNTEGLRGPECKEAYYWFSLDSQNQLLYAGVGEPRLETAIYRYQLPKGEKAYLEQITCIQTHNTTPIKILRDPITQRTPLYIKDMDDLTMDDIASENFLPRSWLSPVSQKMYDSIAGRQFVLDDPSFPDFSAAIERNIATPGCWCYETLKKKASEFGKPNILETYLRITLGQNNGESPGIPYVMEIWPPGHYSPIHSHAGANAIIRVLHGSIHVRLYPFLCPASEDPFAVADFQKGDITWISPMLNQVHQLENVSDTTCVTIQCYSYDYLDKSHYDYFDYISEGEIKQYEPDSDMDFVTFKKMIRLQQGLNV